MKYILVIVLFLPLFGNAQIIRGKIVDRETRKPVESADVFIDQTSVGTSTNASGSFELDTKGLQQQVIVNAFGYKGRVFSVKDFNSPLTIDLENEAEELQEVVIDASLFSRKELLKTFRYFFLGNSVNGKQAVIENEDDLVLYYDREKSELICESPKPIRIHNRKLGYHVLFYLKEARISFRRTTIDPLYYRESAIFGFTSFTDLSKKPDQFKKIRKKAFQSSANPFWLAFVKDKLKESNYYFYINKMLLDRDEYFRITQEAEDYKVELIKKPVAANFKGNDVPAFFNVTHVDKKEERSLFYVMIPEFKINRNGFLLNSQSILYGGYYADLKVGDMLPVDYQP